MKIVIANDHAATDLKFEIKEYIESLGHEVINIGTDSHDSCNYPEYGAKAARMVAAGSADLGVLICGTGVGISLAANKVKGIRCGVCSDTATARLIRAHNNANMIAFGQKFMALEDVLRRIDIFLSTNFEGGRHATRVQMIMDEEK